AWQVAANSGSPTHTDRGKEMSQERSTVLVSETLFSDMKAELQERFPQVDFVGVPSEGKLPPEAFEGVAFFRSAMDQDLFHELLQGAPRLDWVHISAAGFDWLMSDEVRSRLADGRLTLTRSANSYNVSIGEFVIGAMFHLARNFP